MMNQPILTVHIVALANLLGGGSVFIIRLVFVLISMLGLVGLFFLVMSFFGRRAAIIALIIGSLDRYLVCCAPRMVDKSVIIAIVPWVILQFHMCANSVRKRDWLVLGILFGIGYNIYPLILLLLPPFFFYLLVYPRFRKALAAPPPYLALGVLIILMLPHLIWDIRHGSPNLQYVMDRSVRFGLGITPRFLLLYIGDLLVSLKDTTWIILNRGYQMYFAKNVTCDWVAGLFYLLSFLYSFRFHKKDGYILLSFVIIGIAIPVSLLFPAEPWNNFWHANGTVYPLIAVTSLVAERLASRRAGKLFIMAIFSYLGISLALFLGGPKWGYMSPDWEKAYAGKMEYFLNEELFGKTGFREARNLAGAMIARHPKSAIACYYKFYLSENNDAKLAWLKKALEYDPGNPLIILEQAEFLSRENRRHEAIKLLRGLLDNGRRYFEVYSRLGWLEYEAGDYSEAERHICEALQMKPDDPGMYKFLFFTQDALGKREAADKALQAFAVRSSAGLCTAYAIVADEFIKKKRFDKAAYYVDKIRKAIALPGMNRNKVGSNFIEAYYNLGARYTRAGKDNEAIEIFNKIVEIDPRYAPAYNALTVLFYKAGRYDLAVIYFDKASALGYHVGHELQAALEAYRTGRRREAPKNNP